MGIDLSTINPSIVYLILIFGLWTSVTAVYVAGTGILEFVAFGAIAVSLVIMAQMQTNWIAVLVTAVGVSAFVVAPFIKREYAPYALIGLAAQAVAGLFLFEGQSVSLLIIGLTVVVPLLYYYFALVPIMERARLEPDATRDELIIGQRGIVMNVLNPIGTVNVDSELWTAISEDEDVAVGQHIIVVGKDGLKLIVEPIKQKNRATENGHTPQFDYQD